MSRAMKAVALVVLCALIIAVPSVWAYWVQDGVALCTATGTQSNPAIVSDGAGGAIVVWEDNRSGDYADIYAQRVDASGAIQWMIDGVTLCTAMENQMYSTIISDGAGGAIVAWGDARSGDWNIYAQRVDASGTIQWMTDGVALCTATGMQWYPKITSDGAGGAIVVWEDYRSGDYADIYAQRVNALGAVEWTIDGVALCTATKYQLVPTITSDGVGGAIVTWEDSRSGTFDIYVQRVNPSGDVQWTANGVALSRAAGVQRFPTIISDGASGAIVTWDDYRNYGSGNVDIYAQRVNASGAVEWTIDGVALCTATGYQMDPTMSSDGGGGAIVTWESSPNAENWDIYTQRVNASGAVQWTTDGVAICIAEGNQWYPTITSDGGGGAIVTWLDYRSGNADIYAQRVNDSGSAQWTADGIALCTAMGEQESARITSDGAGGAIVAWWDHRSGTTGWDIYAQIVYADGSVPTAAGAPAVPIELHQNYPNPFNPTTTVTYSVAEKCSVTLKIYDVSGKYIVSLADRKQEKGSYAVEWNGQDEKGNLVASGIYLYRIAAGNQAISRKMVLLR